MRGKFASLSDDEMTNVIPSKAIGDALESARAASPRPAAGMPPPAASSGKTQLRDHSSPSPNSKRGGAGRSGKFAAIDDEEEDGRTVVRGAPKIVKRGPSSHRDVSKMGGNTMPTTISPAAVIKATLESAKAGKRGGLMSPPPTDLLEDLADIHPADGPGAEHTKILPSTSTSVAAPISQAPHNMHGGSTQAMGSHPMSQGSLPPSSVRPVSAAPPPMMNQSGGYPAQQSGAWAAQYNGPVPSGSVSVAGVAMPAAPQSMPAHFMVPQVPYSDARIDPPGTALTARTKAAGRPAMSWAVALMAFGLFVGVGAFAAMQNKGDSAVMTTSAAFVDPARAGQPAVAAAALQAPATPVAMPAAPPAADPNAAVATAPGVVVPAAPATVAAPVVAAPGAPAPTVAVAPVAAPPAAVAPPPPATVAAAAPAPTTPRHVRSSGGGGGTRVAAAAPEEAPAPVKPARTGKGAGGKAAADNGGGVDEEQKKALKALQESQLESTF